jgi:hypothetical protein
VQERFTSSRLPDTIRLSFSPSAERAPCKPDPQERPQSARLDANIVTARIDLNYS